MTVELKPVGVGCNLNCTYCYNTGHRTKQLPGVNIYKMLEAAKRTGSKFSLHGGEPLLLPLSDLEDIFWTGYDRYGCNSLQTNGLLITNRHIELFRKYNVGVGLSLDGFSKSNAMRCGVEDTAKIVKNLKAMRHAGVRVSVISVVTTITQLEEFKEFGSWLDALGVHNVNLHQPSGDTERVAACRLGDAESIEIFLNIAKWLETRSTMRWNPFLDMESALRGSKNTLCTWNACDPLNTNAVIGIETDYSISNCGRMTQNETQHVSWSKAQHGYERQISLYYTPQDKSGCRGCRFFLTCTGGCPGEAEDGDWRNRTRHCELYKTLFKFYETKLLGRKEIPISMNPKRKTMEASALQDYANGHRPQQCASNQRHGDQHGDHTDHGTT